MCGLKFIASILFRGIKECIVVGILRLSVVLRWVLRRHTHVHLLHLLLLRVAASHVWMHRVHLHVRLLLLSHTHLLIHIHRVHMTIWHLLLLAHHHLSLRHTAKLSSHHLIPHHLLLTTELEWVR